MNPVLSTPQALACRRVKSNSREVGARAAGLGVQACVEGDVTVLYFPTEATKRQPGQQAWGPGGTGAPHQAGRGGAAGEDPGEGAGPGPGALTCAAAAQLTPQWG